MTHDNSRLAELLADLDLGNPVAETDRLLEVARVETSTFRDLLNDRVDLVPGTKGSGKSALFTIFVKFLPDSLLQARRVVVAHGVDDPGDPVFDAFRDEFERLDERDFVAFWCIYLVSLAQEQFIKGARYAHVLRDVGAEVAAFRTACASARIPDIQAKRSLPAILQWTFNVLKTWRPKFTYQLPEGQGELGLELGENRAGSTKQTGSPEAGAELPLYLGNVRRTLEAVLARANLSIWLMIDRLDEIFPRRSQLERTALRGLLRAMHILSSEPIRVKVFLRDDMLEHIVEGDDGFVALTHVTARQADTLRWTEDQILSLITKRIFANKQIGSYLEMDAERLDASANYRAEAFYKVFPPQVHLGGRQSSTLTWLYKHCADGRGVVTPRDVLDLLIRAAQRQQDACRGDLAGRSEWMIGPAALQYGHGELSKRKRITYLQAEFPHLWPHIEKLVGGKAEYSEAALRQALGSDCKELVADLTSIGIFASTTRHGAPAYTIPFLYRRGLEVTQGRA